MRSSKDNGTSALYSGNRLISSAMRSTVLVKAEIHAKPGTAGTTKSTAFTSQLASTNRLSRSKLHPVSRNNQSLSPRNNGTIQSEGTRENTRRRVKSPPVSESHQCLKCQLYSIGEQINNLIYETTDPRCSCDDWGRPLKHKKKKMLLGRKITTIKDILLGVYKTEKAH